MPRCEGTLSASRTKRAAAAVPVRGRALRTQFFVPMPSRTHCKGCWICHPGTPGYCSCVYPCPLPVAPIGLV